MTTLLLPKHNGANLIPESDLHFTSHDLQFQYDAHDHYIGNEDHKKLVKCKSDFRIRLAPLCDSKRDSSHSFAENCRLLLKTYEYLSQRSDRHNFR